MRRRQGTVITDKSAPNESTTAQPWLAKSRHARDQATTHWWSGAVKCFVEMFWVPTVATAGTSFYLGRNAEQRMWWHASWETSTYHNLNMLLAWALPTA